MFYLLEYKEYEKLGNTQKLCCKCHKELRYSTSSYCIKCKNIPWSSDRENYSRDIHVHPVSEFGKTQFEICTVFHDFYEGCTLTSVALRNNMADWLKDFPEQFNTTMVEKLSEKKKRRILNE